MDRNARAKEYGPYYGIHQQQGESDDTYRERVAGWLRQNGHPIEAHEVYSGMAYDDPNQGSTGPMMGIVGAMAQALTGHEYSPHDGVRQIGDDIAAGVVASAPPDPMQAYLAQVFDLMGPEAGMNFLDPRNKNK